MLYAYVKEQAYGEEKNKNQPLFMQIQIQGVAEDNVYVDDTDRTELIALLSTLSDGDQLIIRSVEDIADSYNELLAIFEQLSNKEIDLYSCKEPFFCGEDYYRDLKIIIGLNEFYKRASRKAAFQKAVKAGTVGRPKNKAISKAVSMYESGEYTVSKIEKATGVSKSTLYRAIKR
jgi:DNA invertase Pin-like site-specific DNA recombinase